MKLIRKIDATLPAQGWKAALTGLAASLLPLINEILVWVGVTPMPQSLVNQAQTVMALAIALFLGLKVGRTPVAYDGRS